jgi:hypothetical protein
MLIKQVIKFANGDYWYHYQGQGPDLQKAWTFNKVSGAQNTIQDNDLQDCTIHPVEVQLDPEWLVKSKT